MIAGLAFASQPALAESVPAALRGIFERNKSEPDLARAKLEIDRLIDPSIDVDAHIAELDRMAAAVRQMVPANATDWEKMHALRTFIYEPGPWNDRKPFAYDHDDPWGQEITNKLLPDYLKDRRGNCVSMPLLLIFLAERLDLDVAAASAPLHIFVKFTDGNGKTWNLEATSGAGPTRDVWYRQINPMTDEAVKNGVYLRALSPEETVALMAAVVATSIRNTRRCPTCPPRSAPA